ncbi:MAG: hypothetical protein D6795_11895, partial [Deltaproteobacteria bacterium]
MGTRDLSLQEKSRILKESLKLLSSARSADRLRAIRQLRGLGKLTSTVKLFSYHLQDPDPEVRCELVAA